MKTIPHLLFHEVKDFTSEFLQKNIRKGRARRELSLALKKSFKKQRTREDYSPEYRLRDKIGTKTRADWKIKFEQLSKKSQTEEVKKRFCS